MLLIALAGCGTSYEYLPPVEVSYVPPDVDNVEIVEYRQLTRRDFRAEEPSLQYRSKKSKIGATLVTYVSIAVVVDAIEVPTNPDSIRWEPITEGFAIRAIMIPDASWWSPKNKEKDIDRILEHEQVHFAISELEARRLNTQLDEILKRIRVNGSSQVDATTKTFKQLQKERDRIQAGLLAMQAKFDLESKNGTDKVVQKHWLERMEKLIDETDPLEAEE